MHQNNVRSHFIDEHLIKLGSNINYLSNLLGEHIAYLTTMIEIRDRMLTMTLVRVTCYTVICEYLAMSIDRHFQVVRPST